MMIHLDIVSICLQLGTKDRHCELTTMFVRLLQVEEIRGWIHDVNHNTQLIRRLHSDPTYHTNKRKILVRFKLFLNTCYLSITSKTTYNKSLTNPFTCLYTICLLLLHAKIMKLYMNIT